MWGVAYHNLQSIGFVNNILLVSSTAFNCQKTVRALSAKTGFGGKIEDNNMLVYIRIPTNSSRSTTYLSPGIHRRASFSPY